MSQYAAVVVISFLGGLINGATGFGALIVMVPLLLMFLDMSTAIPMGVLCCIIMQAQGVVVFRKHIHTRNLLPLVLGSLPGVWLGSSFLSSLPEVWLRTALGLLCIGYAIWSLAGSHTPVTGPPKSFWAYIAGFFSGALGGAFGISGPPAVIYATQTGWPPPVIRGTLNTLFTLLFIVVAVAHFLHGLLGREVWQLTLLSAPVCFLGSRLGMRMTAGMLPEQYLRLIFLFISVMGLSLCWPALRLLLEYWLLP